MEALVTFYSKTGTTERVAGLLAEKLRSEGVEVTVAPIKTKTTPGVFTGIRQALTSACPPLSQPVPDPSGYDLVFLGYPVWAGRPAPAVNSFLSGLKSPVGRQFAPFATCGGRGGHQAPIERVSSRLAEIGHKVVASQGFCRRENPTATRQAVEEFVRRALAATGKME